MCQITSCFLHRCGRTPWRYVCIEWIKSGVWIYFWHVQSIYPSPNFPFYSNILFTPTSLRMSGFIFPLMCAGCAFGRFLYFFVPDDIPMQIIVLCTAAAMNVAITRTTLATTLILAFLPGEPIAIPPLLMSSICSLFATSYMVRNNIEESFCDQFPKLNFPRHISLQHLSILKNSPLSRVRSQEVTSITVSSTKSIKLMSIVSLVTQRIPMITFPINGRPLLFHVMILFEYLSELLQFTIFYVDKIHTASITNS